MTTKQKTYVLLAILMLLLSSLACANASEQSYYDTMCAEIDAGCPNAPALCDGNNAIWDRCKGGQ